MGRFCGLTGLTLVYLLQMSRWALGREGVGLDADPRLPPNRFLWATLCKMGTILLLTGWGCKTWLKRGQKSTLLAAVYAN